MLKRSGFLLWTAQWVQPLPRVYWYLWLGTLLNKIGWLVVPFLTIYLTEAQCLSVAQATLVGALVGLGSFICGPIGGILADQLGRRRTLLLALSGTSAATLALGLVHGVWLITLLAFVLGCVSSLYGPAASALIADSIEPSARPHAYRLQYWATNVGVALAPLLAGIAASWSYLALFVIDALTTALFGLLVWLRVPETRSYSISQPLKEPRNRKKTDLRGFSLLFLFTLLAFVFACIWFQGYVALPLDMHAHGLTSTHYAFAIALNGLVVIVLSVPLGSLFARFPRHYVLAGATLLLGTGFGLTALVSTLPLYAFTVILWTLGEIAAVPLATALIADLSPSHLRGLYQGVYGAAWGLASFVGPALSGLIIEQMGTRVLWFGCFLVG
jgi:MFS family permease